MEARHHVRLSVAAAKDLGARILGAMGAPADIAAGVARHLALSDASGHASHGLSLLPVYAGDLDAGRIVVGSRGRWIQETGAALVIDGERGFGAPVANMALARAVDEARRSGVCLLAVRNVHHLGRIGAFAEEAAEAGLASLHFCNVVGRAPVVVPAGGREARFVTNPLAVGIPRPGRFPVVLDIATSGIALNKARVAHLRGEAVEPGYLVDAEGHGTTDPGVLFREPRGALLPFGLHKGSGLAVVGELLAGALSGGRTIAPHNERDGSTLNNMLSILIAPDHLAGAAWREEAEAMIGYLHDCPPVDPDEPVLVPGEPEAIARQEAEAQGIAYDAATWGTLTRLAEERGVALPPL
ncbi:MAG TPA: malate/lactate/ureidoglycolate dehydrogenase [Microvirga sp.]|jgi:LDH2 family malate/lactate/ureidoglycolate dehydrogenase|nr:malate/lactate/ureidoglycolate dehydrogenase [Microvirga sp.]